MGDQKTVRILALRPYGARTMRKLVVWGELGLGTQAQDLEH